MTPNSVDEKYAVDLIARFLPEEWSDVHHQNVSLKPFSGGFINSLWIVDNNKKNGSKYNKVIIRHYGGNMFGMDNNHEENGSTIIKITEVEEVLIFQSFSEKGWGPELLGVFPGGRLEEYIPSHTLTHTEASDPDIIHDVAVSFARFHSMKLPAPKDRLKAMEYISLNPPAKRVELMKKFPSTLKTKGLKYMELTGNHI